MGSPRGSSSSLPSPKAYSCQKRVETVLTAKGRGISFLPAARPSGPREVRVVVVAVEGSSLPVRNLQTNFWLHEFTSGWNY